MRESIERTVTDHVATGEAHMSREIARWLISVGAAIGTIGIVVIGMAMAYLQRNDGQFNIGLILTIAGAVATLLGAIAYRRAAEPVSGPPVGSSRLH